VINIEKAVIKINIKEKRKNNNNINNIKILNKRELFYVKE
jgi:hypothetical protein